MYYSFFPIFFFIVFRLLFYVAIGSNCIYFLHVFLVLYAVVVSVCMCVDSHILCEKKYYNTA
jgi:hypothetical protein